MNNDTHAGLVTTERNSATFGGSVVFISTIILIGLVLVTISGCAGSHKTSMFVLPWHVIMVDGSCDIIVKGKIEREAGDPFGGAKTSLVRIERKAGDPFGVAETSLVRDGSTLKTSVAHKSGFFELPTQIWWHDTLENKGLLPKFIEVKPVMPNVILRIENEAGVIHEVDALGGSRLELTDDVQISDLGTIIVAD